MLLLFYFEISENTRKSYENIHKKYCILLKSQCTQVNNLSTLTFRIIYKILVLQTLLSLQFDDDARLVQYSH